ncbi:hypothetical protein B484DRAFT_165846 [Ochromonadaceae sp. CCMP2298]|nr:hypothetical protein B484DRAFT_165846 [Ochromonadaceae sp. CCMP2298]
MLPWSRPRLQGGPTRGSKSTPTQFTPHLTPLPPSLQHPSLGFPVFDADLEVHRLYAKGGSAVTPMGEAFPDAVVDGAVDRAVLSAAIIADISGTVLRRIEAIVHPLVIEGREAFYAAAQREGRLMVIYDIPLLFENMHKYQVDYIIVATAAGDMLSLLLVYCLFIACLLLVYLFLCVHLLVYSLFIACL